MNRNWLYTFSLTPGLVAIYGNLTGGFFAFGNVIFSLVFLAISEWITKDFLSNDASEKDDIIPKFILILHIPLQLLSVASLFYGIYTEILTDYFIIGAALSTGLNSGSSAIIVSHEYIHRKVNYERMLGKLLLFSAGNLYFYIDHLKVHHKWVGTNKDHATARFGESMYAFFIRSVSGQFWGAINIEAQRLKTENKMPFGLGNYVIRQLVLQAVFVFCLYYFIGVIAVGAWIIQCFFANFLLEYVNYIQHYGLNRNENQRVTEEHSWQSDKFVSRFVLVDLSRHADHHYYASKPYHTLKTYHNSPVLPTGYAGLFFIAAVPKLWFSIMNKKINELNLSNK
ncbi:MAG: alkane 1-monooxygenase [Bacteroidia bacterium]